MQKRVEAGHKGFIGHSTCRRPLRQAEAFHPEIGNATPCVLDILEDNADPLLIPARRRPRNVYGNTGRSIGSSFHKDRVGGCSVITKKIGWMHALNNSKFPESEHIQLLNGM